MKKMQLQPNTGINPNNNRFDNYITLNSPLSIYSQGKSFTPVEFI